MKNYSTYHLTPIQEGMFFHCLAAPHSGDDVAQVIGTLNEPLDHSSFTRAWQWLVNRHEALRMRFLLDEEGKARQFPLDQVVFKVDQCDWSNLSAHQQGRRLEVFLTDDRRAGFDPRTELPIRVTVFKCSERKHQFVWTWWHGILDGRACLILLQELFHFYEAFKTGGSCDLPLPRRYTDYTEWLAGHNAGQVPLYWKELLAGFSDSTPIDDDRPVVNGTESGYGRQEVHLPQTTTEQLRAFAKEHGVTMNTLIQGAWALVLAEFSGQNDVVFGTTRACRRSAFDGDGSGEGIVGELINTVPVRVRIRPEGRVADWLKELREQLVSARPYELTPLVAVQSCSGVRAGRRLFDSVVVYENQLLDSVLRSQGGNWVNRQFDMLGQTGLPLTVFAWGEPELLLGILNDRTRIDDARAKQMLAHLSTAVVSLIQDADRKMSAVPLLPESERKLLLDKWNRTAAPYPEQGSIQGSFEEIACRKPDAQAITCRNKTWTFRQLNARADMIARCLRSAGAGPETIVGVCLERSLDLVAGMLGVLKAGAAYLPLDSAYPPERLAIMIEDAQPLLVLSNEHASQNLLATNVRILSLDHLGENHSSEGFVHRDESAGGDQLAYVIFTSGSTGRPKGVMVEHRNVMNFFTGMDAIIGSEPGVWLAVASVSFDISVLEIWWSLTRGFQVVLWPGVEGGNEPTIPELIRLHGVSHMQSVPSLLRTVMKLPGAIETLANISVQVVGGEDVPPALIRDLGPSPTRRIFDMYGPTETTVISAGWEVKPYADSITIGRPIVNTQTFILSRYGQPAPVGVVGELFIGGAGVSRGYLNRPELNNGKFVRMQLFGKDWGRIYRTGDLARYLPDGRLEYIGRIDRQAKVRGHRLELGGIETVLSRHPAVQTGVVEVQSGANDEKRLVAYIVSQPNQEPSAKELREWMGQSLPSYMVPAVFVTLDTLPKNENGKLDRKALPQPEAVLDQTQITNRQLTLLEMSLLEVWRETLAQETIGVDDDFFELGGDSLTAVNLILAIEKRHGVKLPLETLLEAPTAARFAEKLEELTARQSITATDDPASGMQRHVPPRTVTERRLLAIWERLLTARPIGIRDSFVELQDQSTLLDQMLIEIKREFGATAEGAPMKTFMDEPTIEALARNIDANSKPAASLVVCLQSRGSNLPLFLVHDGGSNVFVYRRLAAQLGKDRPVYAIRAESNSDGFPFYKSSSLKQVAARYVAEIKHVQAKGPYSLGGACVGGVIAFEMACQLRSQGETVLDPVLLFDALMQNNPNIPKDEEIEILQSVGALPPDPYWTGLRRRFKKQINGTSALGLMKNVCRISGKILRRAPSGTAFVIRRATRKLYGSLAQSTRKSEPETSSMPRTPDAVELIRERLVNDFMPASIRLQAKYVPPVYQGSVALLKAKCSTNVERMWTALAQDGIVVHEVPGTHLDILEEPAVVTTAELVRELLSTQRINRIEICRFVSRVDSELDTVEGANHETALSER